MKKLQEMMNAISDLGKEIRQKSEAIRQMALDEHANLDEMEKIQGEMDELVRRQDAMKASYETEMKAQAGRIGAGFYQISGQSLTGGYTIWTGAADAGRKEEKPMSEIRKSNEYVRAFAFALRNGLNRLTGRNYPEAKILYDALSEGGGDPVGTDGGFLVPEDVDNSIRELRRELNPLADLFNVESVTAPTGWRVVDTAPTAGMSKIDEMGTVSKNDQPAFTKVTYSLDKYGLILPISNELLADEEANLMAYVSRWFARKLVLTENTLLITALKTLTASALGSSTVDPIAAIKAILNKTLDPAIANSAVIITNQTGFDACDQLTDEMGRGLLQPDPTNSTIFRMFGKQVVKVSDAQLPNTSSKPEFFIGDMKEFATLFRKDGFEIASTNIGGDAWAKDMTEVRGLVRMCVSKFDTSAVVRRQLTLS